MNWLEIAGTIVGLIYLVLEYRANKLLWIAGVIMPAIYVFVYYDAGLYADFGINIYYLLIAVYGYLAWTFGKRTDNGKQTELPINRLPRRSLVASLVISVALFCLFAYILITFTDSNVPWLDSFTTAVSVVGLWMLARKYVEQWIAWIAVDAVSTGLYIYKELYFTSALYAIYTIIAIFGYYKWKRLMQDNDD